MPGTDFLPTTNVPPQATAPDLLPALADGLPSGGDVGLAVFFAVGLLGGAHCLGMCGPLVTLYADRMGQTDRSRGESRRTSGRELRQHLLFNLGRTLGYALVGAALGLLGAVLYDAAAVVSAATSVRAVAGLLVGGFIVLTGVGYLVRGSVESSPRLPVLGGAFSRVYGAITGRVDRWVGGPRIVALGTLHAFLPCPILYPAFLYALARGSPVEGALSLTAVGLGTLPTLLAYGTVFGRLDAGSRVRLHRVLGAVFVVLGYLPLSHGLMLLGVNLPHPHVPVYQPLG
jgi:hypothetical protein